jgi:hypothetical protein
MSKAAKASTKIALTVIVSSLIAGSAFAAARTYVPKNTVNKKELETCRLKKASPIGKITECRYQRQSRGKDVFMTIEMPNADCMREFQCEREKN